MRKWIWIVPIMVLAGCSSDDSGASVPSSQKVSFVAIGEDLDKVYQFSYDGNSASGTTVDLTQELGVSSNYLTLGQQGETLSFYTFRNGAFSLALKNLTTEEINIYENFYTITPEKAVTWGINNDFRAFFGYFGPAGSSNLGLQDVELIGTAQEDVVVDFNVASTYRPLLYNGKIYMAFRDNLGVYKLAHYDIATMAIGGILILGPTPISFFVTEAGDIAIVKNEAKAALDIHSADDLSFMESIEVDVTLGFSPGVINNIVLEDDQLYFNFQYPQPSRFVEGPAIYDLNTKTTSFLDLAGLVNQAETEIGKSIAITTQSYDPSQAVFLIAYGTLDDEVEGGILVVSAKGELLLQVSTPFFPTYFVRN
ncbi:MAG: hypothetical protein R2819_06380 [Allomuricauda sp.]